MDDGPCNKQRYIGNISTVDHHSHGRVPLYFVQIPLKTLARKGLTAKEWELAVVTVSGVRITEGDYRSSYIPAEDYEKFFLLCLRVFGEENSIRWILQDIEPYHIGPLGMGMVTAPDVSAAVDLWVNSVPALVPIVHVERRNAPDSIFCRYELDASIPEIQIMYTHLKLLLLRKLLILSGAAPSDMTISFSFSREFDECFYREIMGILPLFDQPQSGITLSGASLNTLNSGSSPLLYRQSLYECEQLIHGAKNGHRLTRNVFDVLSKFDISGKDPSLEMVAAFMNMSPRTLSRKLSKESTTFREVLSSFRIDKAKELLVKPELSVKVVSNRSGFSGESAFSRAFRRSVGLSPSEYRSAFIKC